MMIEDGTTGRERAGATVTPAQGERRAMGASPRTTLSARDVRRLTLFKWRYSLESTGFSARQAEQLLFLRWLYIRRGPLG